MPLTIKAIVIRPPFWQQIVDGTKKFEHRSWETHFRGWLAVVAARQRESGDAAGKIVCFVPLLECIFKGQKNFAWRLGNPVPAREAVEIPGRLGIFDVTERIPDHLKAELAALPDAIANTKPLTRPPG